MSIEGYRIAAEAFQRELKDLIALPTKEKLADVVTAALRLQLESGNCSEAEAQDGVSLGTAICLTLQAMAQTIPGTLPNQLLGSAIVHLAALFARKLERLKAVVSKREEIDSL